ncbi:MAG: hypothetical protein H6766_04890 [Candidatus Peribacteria bacterium]|nr:MAG: hypothetical protein H6766_04890 [Candidatus Peribacteria bacterium]
MDVARSILGKTATDADISDAEFYTLYAQESRVYSTMYKQLEGKEKGQTSLDAMKAKAQELLKKCAITNTNKKDALSTFINGWNGTGENPTLIQEALGVDITKRNHWL